MKTLEEIAEKFESRCLDGRDLSRLIDFVPWDMLGQFGFKPEDLADEYNTKEKWDANVKEFTRENVLAQLKEDVSFGFTKALNQRGISASFMFEVVRMWNWILEEGLEDWPRDKYAQYGLPLLKATAVKYGFKNPIGNDNGDEAWYAASWEE
jgi:hypothetical protein